MTTALRLAVTADLHWGHQARGAEATRLLLSFLEAHPPDVLVLAGDIGTGVLFSDCLAQFARVPCRRALDDVAFTAEVVANFERQLREAFAVVRRAIVVTHHPPFYGLSFPRPGPPTTLDSLLWDAFCGNRRMEQVLARHAERIAFAF